jgi:hypothetical protein
MGGQVGMGGMGGMGPQMGVVGADGRQYQSRPSSGLTGMLSQYPGMAKPPPLGNRPMPDINDPSKWSAPNMFMDPSQVRPPPQGIGGMLGGLQGGCPPWMPGCQGGGGGYGGGYAGTMPMYGGSRPTLQAQLPAAPRPAPSGSTSLNNGSWMR